jgi:recombination protein U
MRGRSGYANRGMTFEALVEFANEAYRRKGVAVILKQSTKFLPIRDARGVIVTAKVEEKASVDYIGRYASIPVAVEAKHTEGPRIRFDRVQDHQRDYLDDWSRNTGAMAAVLVSFGMNRFFAVPWPFWNAARVAWEHGHESISVEVYGWTWRTPGMASVSAEQLLPEWEIRQGGEFGLNYLQIFDRMAAEKKHEAHR